MSRDESIVNTFAFDILWKESVLSMHFFPFFDRKLSHKGGTHQCVSPGDPEMIAHDGPPLVPVVNSHPKSFPVRS